MRAPKLLGIKEALSHREYRKKERPLLFWKKLASSRPDGKTRPASRHEVGR